MTITGASVLSKPTERPVIMFVPAPVCDEDAMDFTGLKDIEV